ncbi:MAG: 30S ribosomal protein S9 [Candidatus Omnitrophica bacterium]|nr:30S ribosomal protein S9 [Candidatus Omnitrophota bacterium]MBU1871554.1 30S ribosomal protein S9 [Candidatus Omnitrophota bacterium]
MEKKTKERTTGRRKEAVASVKLSPGEGQFFVNKRPLDKYFLRETDRIIVKQPFVLTNTLNKYDIIANIKGGGYSGQAGALRLAIARALISIDADYKKVLKKNKLLTRDPRMRERKKYGLKGARKRFQWTKR